REESPWQGFTAALAVLITGASKSRQQGKSKPVTLVILFHNFKPGYRNNSSSGVNIFRRSQVTFISAEALAFRTQCEVPKKAYVKSRREVNEVVASEVVGVGVSVASYCRGLKIGGGDGTVVADVISC
nr:hypothetical protein [Tanacetum cinerariifolium]